MLSAGAVWALTLQARGNATIGLTRPFNSTDFRVRARSESPDKRSSTDQRPQMITGDRHCSLSDLRPCDQVVHWLLKNDSTQTIDTPFTLWLAAGVSLVTRTCVALGCGAVSFEPWIFFSPIPTCDTFPGQ
ncbi:uncharacterized protein BDV17DRAFT_234398 [Aspergillus undulatus]|uniref:uncharacterized protein n=1 Tax=Aspergillus undulatus TaxID=1810928 RepID=UPI003CCD21B9